MIAERMQDQMIPMEMIAKTFIFEDFCPEAVNVNRKIDIFNVWLFAKIFVLAVQLNTIYHVG